MNNNTINANMGQPVGMTNLNDDQRVALARRVDQVFRAEIELPAQSRRALFEAMLWIDPQHQPALVGLGEVLLELDLRGPAADAFERALQQEPGNLGAIDSLAKALGRDQAEGRIMQRLEALLLEQPDTDALLALASRMCQALALLGADEAPEWENSDGFSEILTRAAQRAVEQNDPHSALRVHEFALGVGEYVQRPGAFTAGIDHVIGRAAMLLRLDRLIEARDAFGPLSLNYPGELAGPNGLIAVGSKMIERQMHPEAAWLLQDVLGLLTTWPVAACAALNLVELGNGFLALGRPDDAIRVVGLVPGGQRSPHDWLLLARAWSMHGQQERAIRIYALASRHFLQIKSWQEAKSSAEEGLAIDPDSAALLKHAGGSSIALGDCTAALVHLSRLVRIEPRDTVSIRFRAVALSRLGRLEEALSDFERAVSLDGHQAHARFGAAQCLIGLANRPRVANEWQTSAQQMDRLRAALGHLQEALLLRPDELRYKLCAARVQYRLGKPRAALRGYQAALAQQPEEPSKLEALRGKALAEGDLGLGADALITALELPIDDPILGQSVVAAVLWRVTSGEGVVPPESRK